MAVLISFAESDLENINLFNEKVEFYLNYGGEDSKNKNIDKKYKKPTLYIDRLHGNIIFDGPFKEKYLKINNLHTKAKKEKEEKKKEK